VSARGRDVARHAVECSVDRLERHRAVTAQGDGLVVRYEATVCVAAMGELP
jgi:hypothetical protein